MAASPLCLIGVLLVAQAPRALVQASQEEYNARVAARANPIRKVVSLLQKMERDVTEEGERETELYNKFMCWCKTGGDDLTASIDAGDAKIGELGADIKKTGEKLAQTKEKLAQAQADRSAAKTAMAEATEIRNKEASAFAAEKAEYGANILAINQAVAALEKGMAGAFLQSSAASTLKRLALGRESMLDADRQAILSFLSNGQGSEYAPSSGEVTGILKQMGDEMGAGLREATAVEEKSNRIYKELMAAKTKEVAALSRQIEADLKLVGDLSVSLAQMKNDLGDTEEALLADKEFLANLDKTCAAKKAEWDERVKTRADELAALADAIKMLNDDDALELFKKTLPSAGSSFMQVEVGAAATRARALAALRAVPWTGNAGRERLAFVSLALHGKKVGFQKVIKMIDDLVASLKQEQMDDDSKKEYCAVQFDSTDDSKKALERTVSDEEATIAALEEGIATTKEEIKALTAGIKALDKAVAEATEQRKEENKDYKDLMASNAAAKELLKIVQNRLNKFYNPKLYKAPPKRELSSEDRILVNEGVTLAPTAAPGGIAGTGVTVLSEVSEHSQGQVAPPPPPETFGAYTKKSEESGGVMKLMNMLIADLDKDMTEATAEEKNSQADYETMMSSSAEKRAADSKSLTEKESTKAGLEGDLEAHREAKASAEKELAATNEYIAQLHAECDWLLKYFDARKEARASEIDALGKARAVLSGADYSLVQTS